MIVGIQYILDKMTHRHIHNRCNGLRYSDLSAVNIDISCKHIDAGGIKPFPMSSTIFSQAGLGRPPLSIVHGVLCNL